MQETDYDTENGAASYTLLALIHLVLFILADSVSNHFPSLLMLIVTHYSCPSALNLIVFVLFPKKAI